MNRVLVCNDCGRNVWVQRPTPRIALCERCTQARTRRRRRDPDDDPTTTEWPTRKETTR